MSFFIRTVTFALQAGALGILLRLAGEIALRLPPTWMMLVSAVLPFALAMALCRTSGDPWRPADLGIAASGMPDLVETVWLFLFQTTYLLALLLFFGSCHYGLLLHFLDLARDLLNGYQAAYWGFLGAAASFMLLSVGWSGEILHRGFIQGVGTLRFHAAAGAFASWITFGAAMASIPLRLGYPLFPVAAAWIAAVLLPGPLSEAYYLRNRSLLPLVAIRAASGLAAMSCGALYLYWHPDRALILSSPILAVMAGALLFVSFFGARRLADLWWTALEIVRTGMRTGAPAAVLIAFVFLADGAAGTPGRRTAFCVAALTAVLLRSKGRGSADPRHSASE